jgi:hypothetical protein
MNPGGILCLDLSTETGWAYGHPGDPAPSWGVWKLPKHISRGAVGLAFENEFEGMLEAQKPVRVVYEAPLPPNLQSNADAGFFTIGLAFTTEACAARWEIPVFSRSSQTFRNAVIGRVYLTDEEKRAKPRLSVKTAIVAPWIAAQGWQITDHNAADAAVVWAYETGIRHTGFGKRRAA